MPKKTKLSPQLQAKIAAEELAKRQLQVSQSVDLAADFVAQATRDVPWQAEFLADPASRKALFGERRGGKSTEMAIAAINKALSKAYSQVLYIGLTQDSCKRTMYDQVLSRMLRTYNLPAKLVGDDECRFDNGSIIYLIGLDANKKQKEKVRGTKASLILIDEMQSYTQDTALIINEILGPTAADTKAAIIIGGTAGNALGKNYWHEITKDNLKADPSTWIADSKMHPEWKVYRCSWSENTAVDEQTGNRVCDNVREYLAELVSKHPGIELTDSYRQEWNAEWILQTSARIYRYEPINSTTNLPSWCQPSFGSETVFGLGLDLGFSPDPNGFVITAYNLKYDNCYYVVKSFQVGELPTQKLAQEIQRLNQQYRFAYAVADAGGMGKQIVVDLNLTYGSMIGLNILPADKFGKLAHQNMINSDFLTKQVVIYEPDNQALISQLLSVVWGRNALLDGRYEEDPKYSNHLTDDLLYAHFHSRHNWYEAPKPRVFHDPTNQERYAQIVKQLISRNKPTGFGGIDFSEPNRE